MRVEPLAIRGALAVVPEAHRDVRGRFVEIYRKDWFPVEMVQTNRAERVAGSIVGLHFHYHQAEWWYVIRGHARVVLHDIREGSPTDGKTLNLNLDGGSEGGLYIPAGVAHGFAAHTDVALIYHIDRHYNPTDEHGVAWDDPDIRADWGVSDPVLSERDRTNPRRADIHHRPLATGLTQVNRPCGG